VEQFSDISLQKQFEERITYLAYRDPLTDLPNRTLLRDRVEQAMAMAQRESSGLALLFLDLDRFKNINDSLGHAVGDQLLCEVARRLSLVVRATDTVGRLGGDEFLLLLPGADAEAATAVAQKIMESLSEPCRLAGHELNTSPSIGIALCPRDGRSFDELLKSADTAMYRSKEQGRNTYSFFSPEMNEEVSQRIVLEGRLRRALDFDEFELFYQPQYDIHGQRLVGAEALIRWRDGDGGYVSPGVFIPVAEESSLIESIGTWVLNEACRQARAWMDLGHPLRVSVNFSARQFAAKAAVENVERALVHHGLPGDLLEIEITEIGSKPRTVGKGEAVLHQRQVETKVSIKDSRAVFCIAHTT
jgi:diguanylate cyclase (GGDEF)-like protein